MITVRKGVFETNSSSSHSIVITKADKPVASKLEGNMIDAGWKVNEEGVMDFWYEHDLEFGRSPFDLLTDWYGRLRYCVAYYGNNPNKLNELENICIRRIAGFVRFKFTKDHWEDSDYHGYVDHQSMGLLDHTLEKYDISLEEFIFNDRYIVVIDGDEYCVFNTLIDSDMFNPDSVSHIVSASDGIEEEYWKQNNEDGRNEAEE